MSVENNKVCCNCRHNIRHCEDKRVVCYCDIDNHYIGYVDCMEYWCKHWSKEKEKKNAISNIERIYGIVSPDIQRSLDIAIKALEDRPTGEWIKITKDGTVPAEYICSVCGRKIYDNYGLVIPQSEFYPFCHCGADMRGEEV